MTPHDVRTVVEEVATEIFELDPEEIASDASFERDFGVDSLQKLEFVTTLEQRFGIHYTAHEGSRMDSLHDALTFTQQHLYT